MLQELSSIALEAGNVILPYFDDAKSKNVSLKKDKTPLTDADKASHDIIEQRLKAKFPTIPVLSEEGDSTTFKVRKNWKTFFLIDPLDGTKEFINGNPEYTVNIAVIENSEVIMGVVYAPSTDELYYAEKNKGAYKITNNKTKKISISEVPKKSLRIVVSKSHSNTATETHISELKKDYDIKSIATGSSLKLCKIAEGKADYYPRLGPTMEWDIAAAQIVTEEAGASVINISSKTKLIYNKENLLNPFFLCGHPDLIKSIINKTSL